MPYKGAADTSKMLLSPMPACWLQVPVAVSQKVQAGERLAVIEAMKMENILVAAQDCVVKEIKGRGRREPERGPADHHLRVARAPMQAKPFKILGIQQIAIGGTDKQRLKTLWVDIFGRPVKEHVVSERENVDEDIARAGRRPTRSRST